MDPLSDNKPVGQKLPQYLIIAFVVILAIIGFGVGKAIYKPGKLPKIASAIDSEPAQYSINIYKIPTLKTDASTPLIRAKYAILLDADSKNVMYGRGANDRVPIASITKLMTAIVVSENTKPDDVVTIDKTDTHVIGSVIGFHAGEKFRVSELLKAMLIKSGNDAAIALARTTAGSPEAFVVKMNSKTEKLGLNNTKYVDPDGLSPDVSSTPFDQAILLSYVLNIPRLKEIITTSDTTIRSEGGDEYALKNSNKLITDEFPYQGAVGGKTGFTYEAGHSLAAAAQRDGHTLIAVVLNTESSALDASAREAAKLFDWGFDNYEWK